MKSFDLLLARARCHQLARLALLLCVVLWSAGCTHTACLNKPLQHFDATAGYRLDNLPKGTNSDELFVILAFSGGGTRAAAFSYGVLEQLRQDHVTVNHEEKRLLDEVDLISSVSGGSFTAAYYALFGDEIFSKFESEFLNKDIQGALAWRLALPWNWIRMLSPYFNRSDVAAEYYAKHLFKEASYAKLMERGKPFLVVNSTDLVRGARLEFTQSQFDFLYSDLLSFSVARAVAASSAFPGALSPITLGNYPSGADYRKPEWLDTALSEHVSTSRRLQHAQTYKSYLDKKQRPYIHLVDGGVSDNLGLRGPLWSLESTDWDWSLRRDILNHKVKTVVVISVDAKTDPEVPWNKIESQPNLLDVVVTASTMPMANYSTETAARMSEEFALWQQEGALFKLLRDQPGGAAKYPVSPFHEVKYFPIYLCFDEIPDEGLKREVNDIATNFNLSKKDVTTLRTLGRLLLSIHPEYKRLLEVFGKKKND